MSQSASFPIEMWIWSEVPSTGAFSRSRHGCTNCATSGFASAANRSDRTPRDQ